MEAMEFFADGRPPIDLLLTDIVMPRMGGIELAERVSQLRPETKIILMSGYSEDMIGRDVEKSRGLAFIQKPYENATLVRKVHELLESE